MQIIYTCPECGSDLEEIVLTSNPPKRKTQCNNCGWSHTTDSNDNQILRIPYTIYRSQPAFNFVDIPPACRDCLNHRNNGGNSICHCTLGGHMVYC